MFSRREKSTKSFAAISGADTLESDPKVESKVKELFETLERTLKTKNAKALETLDSLSFRPTNRSGLVKYLGDVVALASSFPLGSKEREHAVRGIRNIAKGEQEKDRYGEVQVLAYPFVKTFLVSEIRDEAADSACKAFAVEAIRNFARNYALKLRVFETEDLVPVIFTTLKQHSPSKIHHFCLVLLTTLATAPTVAEGLSDFYPKDIQELLFRLLSQSAPSAPIPNTDVEQVSSVVNGIRLIQNLSQHDCCKAMLADSEGILSGLARLSRVGALNDTDAEMQALMALANVVGDDEARSDLLLLEQGNEDGLLKLVTLLDRVISGKEIHFNLEMVLRPLRRLCPPDRNRQALSPKLTPLMPFALEQAMDKDDRGSAELAFGILSQLSFDANTVRMLKSDTRIDAALKRITQQSSSGDSANAAKWVKVARAADVLRFNLQKKSDMIRRASFSRMASSSNLEEDEDDAADQLSLPPNMAQQQQQQQQEIKLMISYQWKFQETAKLLALMLKQHPNISVWIDIQKMKAEVMESMADAVTSSDYILMLVSETYKNSSACKCEAMYAFELKKPCIPIIVEKNYTAAGWLGALIAGKLRYDCSDPSKLSQEVPRLLEEIRPSNVVASRTSISRRSSILKIANNIQTVDDVSAWLKQNGMERFTEAFVREQVDGETLRTLRDDFPAFSQDLQTVFGMDFRTRVQFRKLLNRV